MSSLHQEVLQWSSRLSSASIMHINAALGLRNTACSEMDSQRIAFWLLGNYYPNHFAHVSHEDLIDQFTERRQRKLAFIKASDHQSACADAEQCTNVSEHNLFNKLLYNSEVQNKEQDFISLYCELDRRNCAPLKANSEQPKSLINSQIDTEVPVNIQNASGRLGTAWRREEFLNKNEFTNFSSSVQSQSTINSGIVETTVTTDGWPSSSTTTPTISSTSSTTPRYQQMEHQHGSLEDLTRSAMAHQTNGALTLSTSSSSTQTETDCDVDSCCESNTPSSRDEMIRRLSDEVKRLHDELRNLKETVKSLSNSRKTRRGKSNKKQRQDLNKGSTSSPKKKTEKKRKQPKSTNSFSSSTRGNQRNSPEKFSKASGSNRESVLNHQPAPNSKYGSNSWTTVSSRRRRRTTNNSSSIKKPARDYSGHQSSTKSRRTGERPGQSSQFSPATKKCWTCQSTKHLRYNCPIWNHSSKRGATNNKPTQRPRRKKNYRSGQKNQNQNSQPPMENRTQVQNDLSSANSFQWDLDEIARILAKATRDYLQISRPLAT